ncbi:hypothetical protein HQ545_05335 [Candidatus Woesearchaeota archaeon]|nr:hypothetical protein [bacterium]NQU79163.1 hypothetical protein [Candidatus Woesearchaeota archaeon]
MRKSHKLLRSLVVKLKTMRNSGMLNGPNERCLCARIEAIAHAISISDKKRMLAEMDRLAADILSIVNGE